LVAPAMASDGNLAAGTRIISRVGTAKQGPNAIQAFDVAGQVL
jgi:hypothetical protein